MENNIVTVGAVYNTLKHLVAFAKEMGYENPMATIGAADDTAFFCAGTSVQGRVLWNIHQRSYDELRDWETFCKDTLRDALGAEKKRLDKDITARQEIIEKLKRFAEDA